MMAMKERAVDIISHMSEDKVYYDVLKLLEGIEGLTAKNLETDFMDISVNESSGRKLGPLVGGLFLWRMILTKRQIASRSIFDGIYIGYKCIYFLFI
ncbi:MAG: hypothetical protein NC416_12080 [Eubacterium sp.]|nr:hypothetical protein [Eubacterium sp.]